MTARNNTQKRGPLALKLVGAYLALTTRLIDRDPDLPGLGVVHGPSGYGKTWAGIAARNRTGALVVEVGDSWTRRILLEQILREAGASARRGTVGELAQRAAEALALDPTRPLIIDEADRLVDKGMIELVRELHEVSLAPVVLVGEEELPRKLARVERVHNRVLDWLPAQPCDLADARLLAEAHAPGVDICDDLLDEVRRQADGRARRIVVNIARIATAARNEGAAGYDLAGWDQRGFFTGELPPLRATSLYRRAG